MTATVEQILGAGIGHCPKCKQEVLWRVADDAQHVTHDGNRQCRFPCSNRSCGHIDCDDARTALNPQAEVEVQPMSKKATAKKTTARKTTTTKKASPTKARRAAAKKTKAATTKKTTTKKKAPAAKATGTKTTTTKKTKAANRSSKAAKAKTSTKAKYGKTALDSWDVPKTKVCTHEDCGKRKPASSFYTDRSRKEGLMAWCKSCLKEHYAMRRAEAKAEAEREAKAAKKKTKKGAK